MKLIVVLLLILITGVSPVETSVRSVESRIANSPVEIGVFIDARTGAIIAERTGNATSVSFSDVLTAWNAAPIGDAKAAIVAPYRDAIFTHNHPTGSVELSAADVRFAALFNVSEIRVTGVRGGKRITCGLARTGAYWTNYPLTPRDFTVWNAQHSTAFYSAMGYRYQCV